MSMGIPKPSDLFPKPRVSEPDSMCPPESQVLKEKMETAAGREELLHEYRLGNPELPIAAFRKEIIEAVANSQVVVLTAETGAGKSTQVPQILAEDGSGVLMTQPRRLATRSVAGRIRDEARSKGEDYADLVGYEMSGQRDRHDANRIIVATDGLQQIRELSGHGTGNKQVLVLDEVHEWNENMEVLVAWAKKRMREDPDFKVVTMSATLEAQQLAAFFADNGTREVPVIEVPGRTYPVEMSEGGDVADEAIKMARAGKNTLVFVPGVADIDTVIAQICRADIPGVTVLPLYGQLEPSEQDKVFKKYPGTKVIVATNVAQTSITIDDIDAVVDSGLERQKQIQDVAEGLFLNPISQADCLQRAGRAGRTKPGEYVLARLGNNPGVSFAERPKFAVPEILRTRLDNMVLRLAKNGMDAAELEFFHDGDGKIGTQIVAAKDRLQKLGALTDSGDVTTIGRAMERMPVESHYARMMIEARDFEPEVRLQLAALLAAQEANGIMLHARKGEHTQEGWRRFVGHENDSDLIKQLEVYIAAKNMSYKDRREHRISNKAFDRAENIYRQLCKAESLPTTELHPPTEEQRKLLVKAIVSGMVDNLYIKEYYGQIVGPNGDVREVGNRTHIHAEKMIVGTPFDLQIQTRQGAATLHLIEGITNIPSVDLLREVAPQLFTSKAGDFVLDENGHVMREHGQYFNGQALGSSERHIAPASEERRQFLIRHVASRALTYDTLRTTLSDLQHRSAAPVNTLTQGDVHGLLDVSLPDEVELVAEAKEYLPPIELHDLISPEEIDRIFAASPDDYYGIALSYRNGQPMVREGSGLDATMLPSLPEEAMMLPDGRNIQMTIGWNTRYLKDIRQQQIDDQERQEAERQRARDLAVEDLTRYMLGGGALTEQYLAAHPTFDQGIIGRAVAAYDATRQRQGEVAAQNAERLEQRARRSQEQAEIVRRVEGFDSRLAFDDEADMPQDVRRKIASAWEKLATLDHWKESRVTTTQVDEFENYLRSVEQAVEQWQSKRFSGDTVTGDMLAALKAKMER